MARERLVRMVLGSCLGAVAALSLPGAAHAQQVVVVEPTEKRAELPNIAVEVGAGGETFSGELGDVLNAGVGYTGRIILGPRSRLGVELGYLGAWNEAESTLALEKTGLNVYTNSGEALGRLNFGGSRSLARPFVAAGAGYTSINATLTSPIGGVDVGDQDLFSVPLVAGLQVLPSENFTISLRGNYTFLTGFDADVASGNQWGGNVSMGAVF